WDRDLICFLKDKIDWTALFKLKRLSIDRLFLNEFEDYIDFKTIGLSKVNFDGKFDSDILDRIEWNDRWYGTLVKCNPELQDDILKRYHEIINWDMVSDFFILDEAKLDKFQNLNWKKVSRNPNLTVTLSFVEKYRHLLDKSTIS